MRKAVETLAEFRDRFVKKNNPYLFANRGDAYRKIWGPLKEAARKYGVSKPEDMRSTLLRRHLATSLQILDLPENVLDQIGK